MAGDHVLVTDPAEGALHLVATDTLEIERNIPVGGKPFNLTVVGGTGMQH